MDLHALIIGGTGMLREATLSLAERYPHISLIARRPERAGVREAIHPMALDYRQTKTLAAALRETIAAHGPISLAVAWVHSTAPDALPTVLRELAAQGEPFRLIHVRGSAAADPSKLPTVPNLPDGCRYQQVILGFVIEGGRSRWLTNAEISQGVLQAIESGEERAIVGTVHPWSMRPGW